MDHPTMPATKSLVAALVAALSGFAVVRTGKAMTRDGVSVQDGGGWAALLIADVCVNFTAVAVALS